MKRFYAFLLYFLVLLSLGHAQGPANPEQNDCGNDSQLGGWCPPLPPEGEGSGDNGANPVRSVTGNIFRSVQDIKTFGEAPIEFTRYLNSRTTNFNTPYDDFGAHQTWQHNWNYEMRQLGTKTFGFFDIKVRYPDGREYNFKATDSTGEQLAPTADWGDRLYRWSGSPVGYTLVTPDGKEYDFWRYLSPKFKLVEMRNGQGLVWTISHDSSDKVSKIENNFGKWLEITRTNITTGSTTQSVITKVTTSDGREVDFNYDYWTATGTHTLQEASYPGAEISSYTYVGAESLTAGRPMIASASDVKYGGAGAKVAYDWNYNAIFDDGFGPYLVTGMVLAEKNGVTGATIVSLPNRGGANPLILEGNGIQVGHEYNPQGMLVKSWDGEGRLTTYTRSAGGAGFVDEIEHPGGATTSFTRDYAGRVLTKTDQHNEVATKTYNMAGFITSYTDRSGETTTITRNSSNQVERVDYPDGAYEEWTLNAVGQPLTHRLKNGGTVTYTYETNGHLDTFTDSLGNMTDYTYSAAGLLLAKTDPRGISTTYEYNWRGRVTKIAYADSSFVEYGYDDFENLISFTNELGKTWTYGYDEYQHLISVTDPLNRTTEYEYGQESGCASCKFATTLTKITLPSGKTTEFKYDNSWKLIQSKEAPGSSDEAITSYQYDGRGDLIKMTDPRGKEWDYEFDSLHRLVAIEDPLSNRTEWTYDEEGRVVAVTRPDTGVTSYSYDELGRVLTTQNPNLETTTYTYDGSGNLLTLTDAQGSVYTYQYDPLNRKTRLIYPNSSTGLPNAADYEQWTYDDSANTTTEPVLIHRGRDGSTMSCVYNNRNRESACNYSAIDTPDVTKTYDYAGRLVAVSSSSSTVNLTYNDANELLSVSTSIAGLSGPQVVSYSYNADGNRESLTYPDSSLVEYGYTNRNQVANVTVAGPPPLATYNYDPYGNRVGKTLENGTEVSYSYDDASRLVQVKNFIGGTTLAQFDYVLNSSGNRTQKVTTGIVPNRSDGYDYDDIDQLTFADYGARTETFAYDTVGNRTSVIDSSTGTITYTANKLNQYSSVSGLSAITYDSRGNLSANGPWIYTYGSINRLLGATDGTTTASFTYDWQNRKTSRTINGITTYFIYDGWNLIAEYDGTGALVTKYIHGASTDEILAKIDASGTVYYHQDGLGSTICLTDNSGIILESYAYNAFGAPIHYNALGSPIASTAFGNRFLFTGREWIAQIAVYDYRNRHYTPSLGRFLEPDPSRFQAEDVNLYRYIGNDPEGFIDPMGLSPLDRELPIPDPFDGIRDALNEIERAKRNLEQLERSIEDAILDVTEGPDWHRNRNDNQCCCPATAPTGSGDWVDDNKRTAAIFHGGADCFRGNASWNHGYQCCYDPATGDLDPGNGTYDYAPPLSPMDYPEHFLKDVLPSFIW